MNFDVKKTVQYWHNGAEYDIDVMEAMYEKEKYPYALFMGHLALEKLLKALVVRNTEEHAPFTHSLTLLANMSHLKLPQDITVKLARFMEFHFEARYPDEQNKFYEKCTKEFSTQKVQEIKEVFTWLKKKL